MNKKISQSTEMKIEKWMPFFIIICTFLGAVLGTFLIYIVQGEFSYEVLMAYFIATTFLLIITFIKRKLRKNNVPEADERVVQNIFKLFAYTSHIFLAVLFLALGIITLLGKESIPVLYLWIAFFSYIWIVGIGGIIVRKV